MGNNISNRISCLDQWRGLALIYVIINHGFKHTGYVEGLGRSGVNLFFLISGLLTFISLKSLARREKNYFILLPVKRAWRIIPTLLIYTCLTILINGMIWGEYHWDEFFYGFIADSSKPVLVGVGHLWSIAVEMKFYLLSPLIYWLVTRKYGLLYGIGVLGIFLVGFFLHVLGKLDIIDSSGILGAACTSKYIFHVSVWPMMVGFMLGLPYWSKPFSSLIVIFDRYKTSIFWLLQVLVILTAVLVKEAFATSAIALLIFPVLIVGFYGNISFENKYSDVLTYLGKRTYSIYLVQQLLTVDLSLGGTTYRPIGAVLAIFIGCLFYETIEKKFLRPII